MVNQCFLATWIIMNKYYTENKMTAETKSLCTNNFQSFMKTEIF